MAKNFSELRAKMSPERQAKNDAETRKMLTKMPLHELRAARELTQAQLAETMQISQASISKMERNTDMYISTLTNFIKAMGGSVKITATFPDGDIEIDQFQKLGEHQNRLS